MEKQLESSSNQVIYNFFNINNLVIIGWGFENHRYECSLYRLLSAACASIPLLGVYFWCGRSFPAFGAPLCRQRHLRNILALRHWRRRLRGQKGKRERKRLQKSQFSHGWKSCLSSCCQYGNPGLSHSLFGTFCQ